MVGTRKLLRGHYNPTNWTRKYPNLQYTVTPSGARVLACTKCIKAFGIKARMVKNNAARVAKIEAAKLKAAAPKPEKKAAPAKKEKKVKSEKKPAK